MCVYCENLATIMTDFPHGRGMESECNRSAFAHIEKDTDTNKFYFNIDEGYIYSFAIEFCPKCGRKLDE